MAWRLATAVSKDRQTEAAQTEELCLLPGRRRSSETHRLALPAYVRAMATNCMVCSPVELTRFALPVALHGSRVAMRPASSVTGIIFK